MGKNNEVLGQNPEDTMILVPNIEDIETKLTPEQIQKYKDVLLNKEQVDKLKNGQFTVLELSKLAQEQLKKSVDTTKSAIEAFNKGPGSEEKNDKGTLDKIGKDLDEAFTKVGNSKAGEKTKEAFSKVKEKSESLGIGEMIKKAFGSLKSFFSKIGSFFSKLFGAIAGLFVGDKAKEIAGKLSPEKADETREKLTNLGNNLTDKVNKEVGDKLTPKTKKEFHELIKNPDTFSEEELQKITKALEEGKITKISDIGDYLIGGTSGKTYKKIKESLFSKEQIDYLRNVYANEAIKHISSEYNVDLKKLKKEEVENFKMLLKDYSVDEDVIKMGEEYENGSFIAFGKIFGVGLKLGIKGLHLSYELISLIPFRNLAGTIANQVGGLLELAQGNETEQNVILKTLEGLNEEQKNLVLGIMLRKGNFIFNIIQKLTTSVSNIMIGTFIGGSQLNGYTNIFKGFTDDFKYKSQMMDKTLDSLGQNKDSGISKYLKEEMDFINKKGNKLKKIAKIMEVIDNGGDIKKELGKLKGNELAQKLSKMDKKLIKKYLGTEINEITSTKQSSSQKFWGKNGTLNQNKLGLSENSDLNKSLKQIDDFQNKLGKEWVNKLEGRKWENIKNKLKNLPNYVKFNEITQGLEIHVNNLSDGAKQLNNLKHVAKELPRLAGGVVGTAGISVVFKAMGNIEEQENFLTTLGEVGPYILPTIGPIKAIFLDSGIQKSDGIRNSIKTGTELGAMILFLGIDASYIAKEAFSGIPGEKLKNIGKYHIQILKTPFDMVKSLGKIGKSGFKALINKEKIKVGKIDFKKYGKELLKKPSFATILLAGILLGTSNLLDSDGDALYEELEEKGYIKNGEWDYKKIGKIEDISKKERILTDFIWNGFAGINIKINGDKLHIISNNEDLKYKYLLFIEDRINILKDLGIDTTNEESITFEYIKED